MYQLMNGRRGGRSVIKFQNIRIHKSKRLFCFCFIQFLKRECNYKFCLKITKTKKIIKRQHACFVRERELEGVAVFFSIQLYKRVLCFFLNILQLKKMI